MVTLYGFYSFSLCALLSTHNLGWVACPMIHIIYGETLGNEVWDDRKRTWEIISQHSTIYITYSKSSLHVFYQPLAFDCNSWLGCLDSGFLHPTITFILMPHPPPHNTLTHSPLPPSQSSVRCFGPYLCYKWGSSIWLCR